MRIARVLVLSVVASILGGCAAKHPRVPSSATPQPTAQAATSLSFRGRNISAVGKIFWVCGDDEGIARSADGGATWTVVHQQTNGQSLTEISFVDEQTGQAVGDHGLLLSTSNGGGAWIAYDGHGTIRHFSFADATHGITVTSQSVSEPNMGTLDEVQGVAAVDGVVKLTHDGGAHWEEVTALKTDDSLRPFSEILSVAALDASRYLIAFRHPQVAVGYAVTENAGRTWKLVQVPNTYATRVFVHNAEYWAFGIEYLHREEHGGYGAPVSLHSRDGETWIHGQRGPNEFSTCTRQGCSLRDGLVEDLYGGEPKFWILPERGSLPRKWALAINRVCVIDDELKCAMASPSDQAPPRP